MPINGPKVLFGYADRAMDCQCALEEDFELLVEAAENAGWSRREVLDALAELAAYGQAAEAENEETNRAVAAAIRLVRRH